MYFVILLEVFSIFDEPQNVSSDCVIGRDLLNVTRFIVFVSRDLLNVAHFIVFVSLSWVPFIH